MHQINFIERIICSKSDELAGLQYGFIVDWFVINIESGFDAMGVILMGGEL